MPLPALPPRNIPCHIPPPATRTQERGPAAGRPSLAGRAAEGPGNGHPSSCRVVYLAGSRSLTPSAHRSGGGRGCITRAGGGFEARSERRPSGTRSLAAHPLPCRDCCDPPCGVAERGAAGRQRRGAAALEAGVPVAPEPRRDGRAGPASPGQRERQARPCAACQPHAHPRRSRAEPCPSQPAADNAPR